MYFFFLSIYSYSTGVNPDGFDSLVVQYRLGFRELLQVDREAFYNALSSLSITSLVALKSAVPIWIEEAKSNNSIFRYDFFSFLSHSFINLLIYFIY